jgi:hypothetical protein
MAEVRTGRTVQAKDWNRVDFEFPNKYARARGLTFDSVCKLWIVYWNGDEIEVMLR